MASNYYLDGTPDEVKNSKGMHLITQNTPNGQGEWSHQQSIIFNH